jgi:hypothetical protein
MNNWKRAESWCTEKHLTFENSNRRHCSPFNIKIQTMNRCNFMMKHHNDSMMRIVYEPWNWSSLVILGILADTFKLRNLVVEVFHWYFVISLISSAVLASLSWSSDLRGVQTRCDLIFASMNSVFDHHQSTTRRGTFSSKWKRERWVRTNRPQKKTVWVTLECSPKRFKVWDGT